MMMKKVKGKGILNNLLNKVPAELHIPGYNWCGPGTRVSERLARGDSGINPLDSACKEHDIAYSKNKEDIKLRNLADKKLAEKAWERFRSRDASIGEKTAALAVSGIMRIKSKLGMGIPNNKMNIKKRKNTDKKKSAKVSFSNFVRAVKKSMIKSPNEKVAITSALKTAKAIVEKSGGKDRITNLRILPLPKKIGGVIPLVPIFAGLSALGALTGGITSIAKAAHDASMAKKHLEETRRHNLALEKIPLGKGLYLKPHKTGDGIQLCSVKIKKKKF